MKARWGGSTHGSSTTGGMGRGWGRNLWTIKQGPGKGLLPQTSKVNKKNIKFYLFFNSYTPKVNTYNYCAWKKGI